MIGHTPGPWKATPANAGEWNIDGEGSNDWAIAVVCGGAGTEDPNGRTDANARLIAAAPDLLDALGAFIAASEEPGPESKSPRAALLTTAWVKARAAIAKAEGRS